MADSRNTSTINYAKHNIRHSDLELCNSVNSRHIQGYRKVSGAEFGIVGSQILVELIFPLSKFWQTILRGEAGPENCYEKLFM